MENNNIRYGGILFSQQLTIKIKDIIRNINNWQGGSGHVDTGFMLDTTECGYLDYKYDGKIRFIFSIKAPEYFRYVERMRKTNKKQTMMNALKESPEYKEGLQEFYGVLLKEIGNDIKQQLLKKGYKE